MVPGTGGAKGIRNLAPRGSTTGTASLCYSLSAHMLSKQDGENMCSKNSMEHAEHTMSLIESSITIDRSKNGLTITTQAPQDQPLITNKRLARLWNFFSKVDWFKITEWPMWVQCQMLKKHKFNSERYQLFVFFVNNGCSPELTGEWILMQDYYEGIPIMGEYDNSALNQVQFQMPAQFREGTLWKGQRKNYDLIEKRVTLDRIQPMPDFFQI